MRCQHYGLPAEGLCTLCLREEILALTQRDIEVTKQLLRMEQQLVSLAERVLTLKQREKMQDRIAARKEEEAKEKLKQQDLRVRAALLVIIAFLRRTTGPISRTQIRKSLRQSGFSRKTLNDAINFGIRRAFITSCIGARGAEMCQLDAPESVEEISKMLERGS